MPTPNEIVFLDVFQRSRAYDSREAERAARISSHREVVSREMSALAKAGLVEKREGALIIPSLTELNAIQSSQ